MGEGNTPLLASSRLGRQLGLPSLFFKLESCNPSGSYKDRFVAWEMARLLGAGQRACVATSSGNTGSALASCAARYGVACTIVVNEFAPAGKLIQMQAHGAQVIRVPGFGVSAQLTEGVMELLQTLSRERGVALVISAYKYCPAGMAGVETLGQEIVRAIPCPVIFAPIGGGGLVSAVCRGVTGTQARVVAVQPEGCNTLVKAWEAGTDSISPVESTTRVSGLSVPFDIDASLALRELRARNGHALTVSDAEVFEAQGQMLALEGIYTEPAGATALAGAKKALQLGWIRPDDPVVCLVTGHGFKDPDSTARAAAAHPDRRVEVQDLKETLIRCCESS